MREHGRFGTPGVPFAGLNCAFTRRGSRGPGRDSSDLLVNGSRLAGARHPAAGVAGSRGRQGTTACAVAAMICSSTE